MRYQLINADELTQPEVVAAIHQRIQRIWTHSRCLAYVLWRDGRLIVARADEIEGTRLLESANRFVGAYNGDASPARLRMDLVEHLEGQP